MTIVDRIGLRGYHHRLEGEDRNIVTLFQAFVGGVNDRPGIIVVKGQTRAGKSLLVKTVIAPFRRLGLVLSYSRISPTFLEHLALQYWAATKEKEEDDPDQAGRPRRITIDIPERILFIDEMKGANQSTEPSSAVVVQVCVVGLSLGKTLMRGGSRLHVLTRRRSLFRLFYLGLIPFSIGNVATTISQSHVTASITSSSEPPCTVVTHMTWYGFPLPWLVITDNWTYIGPGECQIVVFCTQGCELLGPYFIDVLFYMGIYYLAVLGYLGVMKLVYKRQGERIAK